MPFQHLCTKFCPTTTDIKLSIKLTFDSMHTFKDHATRILQRLCAKKRVLSALAVSMWRKDKLLTTTYKAIAAPVWTPALTDTYWKKVQASQNSALRTITGHLKMTQQDELHSETKINPVKNSNNLISQQFLLQSYKIEHPKNPMHQKQEPVRTLKPHSKCALTNKCRNLLT